MAFSLNCSHVLNFPPLDGALVPNPTNGPKLSKTEVTRFMILFAVFLILFTAWMLFGWFVGESRDIRWMRNWCAGIFVVMAILICLGGGAWVSRRFTQKSYRESVTKLTRLLDERAKEGRMEDVRDAIAHIAEHPDEWSTHSSDILQRMEEVTQALEKTVRTRVAAKPQKIK